MYIWDLVISIHKKKHYDDKQTNPFLEKNHGLQNRLWIINQFSKCLEAIKRREKKEKEEERHMNRRYQDW